MQGQKQRSKLTLVEVLVVVVLLSFAVAVAIDQLIFHRGSVPLRFACGANLAGIGKSMLVYAYDNDGQLPRAGGPGASWAARTPDWRASSPSVAYEILADSKPGRASVSASLYLLVKYAELPPKLLVCPKEDKTTEFEPREYGVRGQLTEFWDFGPEPPRHVSYSYHMPYSPYHLTESNPAGTPVAADRNPWIDSPFAKAADFSQFGTSGAAGAGNCLAHGGDGQNVVFLDGHVEFVKTPNCGIDDDNIYTSWDGADKMRGIPPVLGSVPADPNDALLVNDPASRAP